MMIAKHHKPIVLFRDTKLVSIHMELPSTPCGAQPIISSTCDPILAKFYDEVINCIRSIRRATTRLLSLHGVTDLLDFDSYLRRFYGYVLGIPSGLACPTRHYASSLQDCKRCATSTCQVQSPYEKAWLKERRKWSSVVCHMGLGGIPRLLYGAFGVIVMILLIFQVLCGFKEFRKRYGRLT